MPESKIIKLAASTPLPCSIYNATTDQPCGRLAYAAYAYPAHAEPPGQWLVQPVCRECATKAAANYADTGNP